MRTLPIDAGGIHFVGIGGIGMSGIAEVLHNLGHRVQGSDLVENANIERLRGLGIKVAIGHRAANLGECGVVVVSSAVKGDNPEVEAARGARVPVVRRAEMLGELMRLKWAIAVAGTHGKTTTTSLIAALLDAAKLDPTVINGGIINAYGTNARSGEGDWMVVEADECDGTLRPPAGEHRRGHQHRPRAHGVLRPVRRRARGLPELRREHPVLRLRRALHRPSRGPGAVRPDHRPPPDLLRLQPAGRRARARAAPSIAAAPSSTSSCATA